MRVVAQQPKDQTATILYLAPLHLLLVVQAAQDHPQQILAQVPAMLAVLAAAERIAHLPLQIIPEVLVIRLAQRPAKALTVVADIQMAALEFAVAAVVQAAQEAMLHQQGREEPAAREQHLAFLAAA